MSAKATTSKKLYGPQDTYIKKLKAVMGRLGAEKYNYNWDRFGCWVEFVYRGRAYKFADSIENAAKHGQKISYVSDTFARVVLSLEDIARMKDRGIYDLDTILAGFPALPSAKETPGCFRILGFERMPTSAADVDQRFKVLAKVSHPDAGGDAEQFRIYSEAKEQALQYFKEGDPND
jgi:hypothetical protein